MFFDATAPPYGSMAELALVDGGALFDVAPGVDDMLAAALGNTGLAAWVALAWKARLEPGETVLVLGATGALGTVAVQAARLLGRAAWSPPHSTRPGSSASERWARTRSSPSTAPAISADALRDATDGGAHVIVDPLWGAPALAAMQAAAHGARHIQIGHMAGLELPLPATAVRSRAIELRGFALFHAPLAVRRAAYLRLTAAAAAGAIRVDAEAVPLAAIGDAWERQARGAGTKLVIVP